MDTLTLALYHELSHFQVDSGLVVIRTEKIEALPHNCRMQRMLLGLDVDAKQALPRQSRGLGDNDSDDSES